MVSNKCDHKVAVNATFYGLSFPLVFPLSLGFCCYFLYQLGKSSGTLRNTTAVYVTLALFYQIIGTWLFFLRPILRVNEPIAVCTPLTWAGFVLTVASYIGFQQVLLQRLWLVFKDTTHAVNRRVISTWNWLHVAVFISSVVFFSLYAAEMKCHKSVEYKGWVVDIGMYPKHDWQCSTGKRKFWRMALVGFTLSCTCVVCGNGVLVWMYVRRFQKAYVFHRSNGRLNLRVLAIVRKATIVALASTLTTTLLAVVSLQFGVIFAFVDTLLNVAFLFCQFRFAQAFYNATLARCEPLVGRCLTWDWKPGDREHSTTLGPSRVTESQLARVNESFDYVAFDSE